MAGVLGIANPCVVYIHEICFNFVRCKTETLPGLLAHQLHGIGGTHVPDPVAELVRSRDGVREMHPPIEPGLPAGVAERGHGGVHEGDVGGGGDAGLRLGAALDEGRLPGAGSPGGIVVGYGDGDRVP